MNGRVFPMSEFAVGVTAPPFHPNCEDGRIIPCIGQNLADALRQAHAQDGKPANQQITLEEWEKEFVGGDKSGLTNGKNSDIIKIDKAELSKYIGKPIIETDNQHVREWYYANVSNIPNQIDTSKPFIEQVKQAFELRNQYKHDARVAMSDKATVELLEKKRPAPTFEDLLKDKMKRKHLTEQEALEDILKTASKTNADVNKEFGL